MLKKKKKKKKNSMFSRDDVSGHVFDRFSIVRPTELDQLQRVAKDVGQSSACALTAE